MIFFRLLHQKRVNVGFSETLSLRTFGATKEKEQEYKRNPLELEFRCFTSLVEIWAGPARTRIRCSLHLRNSVWNIIHAVVASGRTGVETATLFFLFSCSFSSTVFETNAAAA